MRAANSPRRAAPVVVLDRDGTIVVDRNYLADPAGLEFERGAAQGLRSMYEQGCRLVVVTNQSGIGRGLFSPHRLAQIHERMRQMIEAIGVRLEGVYYCPHVPADRCDCRKPEIGLFKRAAAELHFEAASAVVIGDKVSDIEFGRRAGAVTILVGRHPPALMKEAGADFLAQDLIEAAAHLETL